LKFTATEEFLIEYFSQIFYLKEVKFPWYMVTIEEDIFFLETELVTTIINKKRVLKNLLNDIQSITGIKANLFTTDKVRAEQQEELKKLTSNKLALRSFYHYLTKAQIKAMYEALKGKFIASDTTLKQFSALFDSKVKQTTPITWLAFKGDLVFLFESLKNEHKIRVSETSLQAKLQRGFINEQKETMSNLKQAKQSYLNNKAGEPTNAEELKAIIASLPK
jgi:hypothetical protein